MKTIFNHIKIIELASVLAGPLCGSFFAELGAQVIKVENKITRGDITRQWRVANEDANTSIASYYAAANFGKEVMLLNLNDDADKAKLLHLLSSADVVISNYKPSAAKKFKLDYQSLQAINPNLIYAALSGFEKNNPRGAYDAVLQAEAGFMFMNGYPNRIPVKIPFAIVDVLSNHQMREAILVALYNKIKTGEGANIHVSMLKAAVSALINQASNFLMNGNIPQRIGSQHPSIAPYGDTFQTKDKQHIVLAVGSDQQFSMLCKILGIEDLTENDLFKTNTVRVINRRALVDILQESISKLKSAKLMKQFIKKQVPAGIIKNMQQVFEHPLSQQMIKEEVIDGVLTKRASSIAFDFY